MNNNPFLVSADWLNAHLGEDDISIVDASWYLPTMLLNGVPRDGHAEYAAQHIPGAVFFDIDDIVEPESSLPHTLASPKVFSRKVGAMGISDRDTIVVYDGMGLFSAPRVWWNFRVMGATKVVILDGGLPRWIEQRLPIESGTAPIYPKLFNAEPDERAIADFSTMKKIVANGSAQIVDARPADRFNGASPEPRPGIRSGHMPGAHSLPLSQIAENGRMKSPAALKTAFQSAGVDLNKSVVTSCGSGVTAAALTLALETLGHRDHRLYDGSWAQWGGDASVPVETGTD